MIIFRKSMAKQHNLYSVRRQRRHLELHSLASRPCGLFLRLRPGSPERCSNTQNYLQCFYCEYSFYVIYRCEYIHLVFILV